MVFNITECVDFHHGKRIVITILVCGHDVVIIMHKEGDALLIQQPVYYPFREVIEDNGRIFVNNQLHYEDGKYTIDFEDFEKKIVDNNVKVFILCNPHNPVGRVWTKEELEKSIHFEIDENTVVVTYHPVTLENNTVEEQFLNLLKVLDRNPKIRMIFTKANADTNGRIVNELIDKYAAQNSERACAFMSLGQKRYLSALKYCRIVIGNSSSGIIEAPSFGKPIINIGDRQKGRICADSVINCGYTQQEIQQAMETALTEEFENKARNCRNPYEKENTAANIISVIKDYLLNDKIKLKKGFYDIK